MCGKVCPSAICQAGKCVGKGFGHEIVIGMDYTDPLITQTSAQVQMLANSVLLVNSRPSMCSSTTSSATPHRRIARDSDRHDWSPRKVVFTSSHSGCRFLPSWPSPTTRCFCVFDQPMAPADQMATNGTLWNGAIDSFAKGGGVVVVSRAHRSQRDRSPTVDLPVTGEDQRRRHTSPWSMAPTDVVGLYLPNVFAARRSVSFTTTKRRQPARVRVKDSPAS